MRILTFILIYFWVKAAFSQEYGTFPDSRDGKTYKTVKIGDQWWMAENLAYRATDGCWAYDYNSNNVKMHGYLYDLETAKKVCPNGFHLPDGDEWHKMISKMGGQDISGKNLKSIGFSHFSGYFFNREDFDKKFGTSMSSFKEFGNADYFWVSTSSDTENYILLVSKEYDDIAIAPSLKKNGYSVRCICDEPDLIHLTNQFQPNGVYTSEYPNKTDYDPKCISGDCENGYGVFGGDEAKYSGNFVNGMPEGYGELDIFGKCEYKGYFKNGKTHGKGTMIWADSTKYVGDWEYNNKVYGTETQTDGSKYIGYFKGDAYHGKGSIYDKYGDWYLDGIFENNKIVKITQKSSKFNNGNSSAFEILGAIGIAAIIDAASDDNSSSNSEISKNSSNSNSSNNTTSTNNSAATSSNSTPSKNNYSLGDHFWIKSNAKFTFGRHYVYMLEVIDYTAVKVQFKVVYEECDRVGSTEICCADGCKVTITGHIGQTLWVTKIQAEQCFSKYKPSCE